MTIISDFRGLEATCIAKIAHSRECQGAIGIDPAEKMGSCHGLKIEATMYSKPMTSHDFVL